MSFGRTEQIRDWTGQGLQHVHVRDHRIWQGHRGERGRDSGTAKDHTRGRTAMLGEAEPPVTRSNFNVHRGAKPRTGCRRGGYAKHERIPPRIQLGSTCVCVCYYYRKISRTHTSLARKILVSPKSI